MRLDHVLYGTRAHVCGGCKDSGYEREYDADDAVVAQEVQSNEYEQDRTTCTDVCFLV